MSFDLQWLGKIPEPKLRWVGSPEISKTGGMTLNLEGGVDDEVFVERSLDLRVWTTLGGVVLAQGKGT